MLRVPSVHSTNFSILYFSGYQYWCCTILYLPFVDELTSAIVHISEFICFKCLWLTIKLKRHALTNTIIFVDDNIYILTVHFCPSFSSPAFSSPALLSVIFLSCIFSRPGSMPLPKTSPLTGPPTFAFFPLPVLFTERINVYKWHDYTNYTCLLVICVVTEYNIYVTHYCMQTDSEVLNLPTDIPRCKVRFH